MKIAWMLTAALIAGMSATTAQAGCLDWRCVLAKYGCFDIPGGSMKPTIEPDACVVTITGPYLDRAPEPGDIVAFRNPIPDTNYIGRVVATEGTEVTLKDGKLLLDGVLATYEKRPPYQQVMEREGPYSMMPKCGKFVRQSEICETKRFNETLPNGASYDILDIEDNPFDNWPSNGMKAVRVPEEHLFLLGDNRDNAIDSRFDRRAGGWGFVSMKDVLGIVIDIQN